MGTEVALHPLVAEAVAVLAVERAVDAIVFLRAGELPIDWLEWLLARGAWVGSVYWFYWESLMMTQSVGCWGRGGG